MSFRARSGFVRPALSALALASILSCGGDRSPVEPSLPVYEARGGGGGKGSTSGPTVSAADPSWAEQGEALDVVISGSGFDQTAQASWERDGVTDPKVVVRGTRFLSSSQVVASITIAPDAAVDLYDVAVTVGIDDGRKKGVGLESFQVTTAQVTGIGGAKVRGAETSPSGELMIVGFTDVAYFWSAGSGFQSLGPGGAFDVDRAGTTVVGQIDAKPHAWERTGSTWTVVPLPYEFTGGWVAALGEDVVSGVATIGVGQQYTPDGGEASVWTRDAFGSWNNPQRLPTPAGSSSQADDVSDGGRVIVGRVRGKILKAQTAAVWEGSPEAGYALTLLAPVPGFTVSNAYGVNSAATLIVGRSLNSSGSDVPTYWERDGNGIWRTHALATNGRQCGWAEEASDNRRIVGRACDGSGIELATLWDLAAGGEPQRLPGLDVAGEKPLVYAITSDGAFAVGTAASGVVYWPLF